MSRFAWQLQHPATAFESHTTRSCARPAGSAHHKWALSGRRPRYRGGPLPERRLPGSGKQPNTRRTWDESDTPVTYSHCSSESVSEMTLEIDPGVCPAMRLKSFAALAPFHHQHS